MIMKLKYYFFLFRWFLIGKYHCDIPKKYKTIWKITHKILWLIIIYCVLYVFCEFILDIDLDYQGKVFFNELR